MPDLSVATEVPVWQFRARVLAMMASLLACSMIAIFTVIWVRLPDESKETFTVFQRLTLIFFSAIILWLLYRMATLRVVAYEEGLTIRNVFRSYRLEWSEIAALRFKPGDAWLQLFDREGTRLGVLAVQASDGPRANAAAKHLATIARSHGAGKTP
jgi:hypothetical protein